MNHAAKSSHPRDGRNLRCLHQTQATLMLSWWCRPGVISQRGGSTRTFAAVNNCGEGLETTPGACVLSDRSAGVNDGLARTTRSEGHFAAAALRETHASIPGE